MTWEDIKRERLNKEAELMIPDWPVEAPNNKEMLAYIKSQRPKKFEPGIYNFVRYTIKSIMV